MYKNNLTKDSFENKILDDLNKISKTISIYDDEEIVKNYSSDWRGRLNNIALCVVFPNSSLEVSRILKYCNEKKISIIPQGGNTGLVYATSPIENYKEIIINLKNLNNIIRIDKINKLVEVESGVIIDKLIDYVHSHNFLFPLLMTSTGSSQVGGSIATNAGGMNVIKYGSTRQNILALEVVLADGEIIDVGSNVIKDNSGYSLKDLFCGSEGTLGIITKATMKIYPLPTCELSCLISVQNIKNVINLHNELQQKFNENIDRCELIPEIAFDLCKKHKFIDNHFFKNSQKYYLLVNFKSFEKISDFKDRVQNHLVSLTNLYDDIIFPHNQSQAQKFWKFRENITEAQKLDGKVIPFDISVPLDKLDSFFKDSLLQLNNILPNIKINSFGHIGDSNIHFNLIEPENLAEDFFNFEIVISNVLYDLVDKYSGSISAEHGIGALKKQELSKYKSKSELDLMIKIKKIFDTNNILNRGKLFEL
jgi:FAD/FMN-containing dehydrogenase